MQSPLSRQSATRSGRQENDQPLSFSPWSSHLISLICYPSKSWWRSYLTDWNRNGEDHCRRTGRFQSRKEHHRDIQPKNSQWEISPAPATPLPRIHWLQEGLRVWIAALWATKKKYNINANFIQVIKHLYDKVSSEVLFNGRIEDCFRTSVRQGCPLSPILFNMFLKRITTGALEDHNLQNHKLALVSSSFPGNDVVP